MNSEIQREKRTREDESDSGDQPDMKKVSIREIFSKSNYEEEV